MALPGPVPRLAGRAIAVDLVAVPPLAVRRMLALARALVPRAIRRGPVLALPVLVRPVVLRRAIRPVLARGQGPDPGPVLVR